MKYFDKKNILNCKRLICFSQLSTEHCVGPIQTSMTKYSAKMFNLFEVCFNMNIGKTKVIVTKTKLKLRNAHQTYFGLICKLL